MKSFPLTILVEATEAVPKGKRKPVSTYVARLAVEYANQGTILQEEPDQLRRRVLVGPPSFAGTETDAIRELIFNLTKA